MPTNIVISGTTYSLPTGSDNPPWGSDLVDIIEALVSVTSSLSNPGDISLSIFSLGNNVTSPTPITGLFFDSATVRSAFITYSIDRTTSTQELVESGTLNVNYNNTTNTWHSTQESDGDAGVTLSISAGQVSFTSTNVTGSSYVGKFEYFAKATQQ